MRGDAQLLTRYWIEFDKSTDDLHQRLGRYGLTRGCGVTAYSYADALSMVGNIVLQGDPLPAIVRVIENIDVRTLDQGHVVANMCAVVWRGVWWPPYGEP